MPHYEVIPHQGVGPVLLGMTREESRAAMNVPPHSFRKGRFASTDTDGYLDNAFQVFFDHDDRVEFIELSNAPAITATYKGRDLFALHADDVVRFVARDAPFDPDDPELGYSYIFPDLELALWRSIRPEDEHDPEGRHFATIGIGKRGYFSNGGRE